MRRNQNILEFHETSTNLKVNLNIPAIAPAVAEYADENRSIRIENMVIETGKHPYVLLNEGKLTSVLVNGIRSILDAFYPKPVWFRTFDIPTDELKNLKGGEVEPENIILSWAFELFKKISGILIRGFDVLKVRIQCYKNTFRWKVTHNLGLKMPFLEGYFQYMVRLKENLKSIGLKAHKDLKVGVSS